MARGRPKSINPRVQRDIGVNADLAAKVDLLLYSELEGRVPYGAWSALIESLLSAWVAKVGDGEQLKGLEDVARSDQGG